MNYILFGISILIQALTSLYITKKLNAHTTQKTISPILSGLIFVVYVILMIISTYILLYSQLISILIVLLSETVFAKCHTGYNTFKSAFAGCSNICIRYITNLLSMSILYVVNIRYDENYLFTLHNNYFFVLIYLLSMIIIIIGMSILKNHITSVYAYLLDRFDSIMMITIALFILYEIIYILFNTKKGLSGESYSLILFIILLFIFLYVERKQTTREQELRDSIKYIPILENIIKSLREERHNYNNHIQTLCSLPYICDNYESLCNELKKQSESLSSASPIQYATAIPNKTLAALIFSKYITARDNDIIMKLDIERTDFNTDISDIDLIDLCGILIDNAIEASKEYKTIYVTLSSTEENRFKLVVANPCDELSEKEIKDMFSISYSTKNSTDDENHGFGLYIARKIIKRNHGIIDIKNTKYKDPDDNDTDINYLTVSVEI